MKRKLIIILITFLCLGTISFLYINNVFLPIQFRHIVVDKMQSLLQRNVTIRELSFHPLEGFVIEDITIYRKNSLTKPFLKVKKASLSIPLSALIRAHQLFIPSLNIQMPVISLSRDPRGKWNFEDMIENLQEKQDKRSRIPFILGSIHIHNGKILYSDQTIDPILQETLEKIDCDVNLLLQPLLEFSANISIPKFASALSAKGNYNLASRAINAKLAADNIVLSRYFPLFVRNKNFSLSSGLLTDVTLAITSKGERINLEGNLNILESRLKFFSGKELSGDLKLINGIAQIENNALRLLCDLNLLDGYLRVHENRQVKGDLSARDTELRILPDKTLELKTSLQINNGYIQTAPDAELTGIFSAADTSVSSKDKKTDITASVQINNAVFKKNGQPYFTGNPLANLVFRYDDENRDPWNYSGTIFLERARLINIPRVEQANQIRGKIFLSPNKLTTESIEFSTLETSAKLSGSLLDFENPSANIKFETEKIQLTKLHDIIPDLLQKASLNIHGGEASFTGTYRGRIFAPAKANIHTTASVTDAEVESEKLKKTATHISGTLRYAPRTVEWDKLQALFMDTEYTLDGRIKFVLWPTLETKIKSENLEAFTRASIGHGVITVVDLNGFYYNSKFDLNGSIQLPGNTPPDLDVKGHVELELSNLPHFFPHLTKAIQKIDPKGVISSDVVLEGPSKEWRKWKLTLDAKSQRFTLSGFDFVDATLDYEQEGSLVNKAAINSSFYGGELDLDSTATLKEEEIPLSFALTLTGIDVAKLKSNIPFQDKHVSGNLNASLNADTSLLKFDKIQGQGNISVEKGYLWRSDLLSGIWKTILIPEYQDIIFTNAAANFQIADRRISATKLEIKSEPVILSGYGWIDFDKNIDFNISPKFKESSIIKSKSLKKGPTALLTQADGAITIKLTGTLSKPSYEVKSLPRKIIEKTTGVLSDVLIDGIKNLFEEIF